MRRTTWFADMGVRVFVWHKPQKLQEVGFGFVCVCKSEKEKILFKNLSASKFLEPKIENQQNKASLATHITYVSLRKKKWKKEREKEMQRLLFQRLTPYLVGRIRQNQRLLSSSSSALQQSLSSDPSPSPDDIHLTENCVRVCSLSLSNFFFGLFHKFGIWVLFLLQFYVLGLSNLWYLLDLPVSWIWMTYQKTLEVWSFWKKNMKWDFCGLCVLLKH